MIDHVSVLGQRTNIVRLVTVVSSTHLCGTSVQSSSDFISVDVAPSHINVSSISASAFVLTNALSGRSVIMFMVDYGMTISSSVSPSFRLDDCQSYGIPLVVSGENDPSWTSRGVVDEAFITWSNFWSADVQLPAPFCSNSGRLAHCKRSYPWQKMGGGRCHLFFASLFYMVPLGVKRSVKSQAPNGKSYISPELSTTWPDLLSHIRVSGLGWPWY